MPNKFYKYKSVLKSVLVFAAVSLVALPQASFATNGMNMEGYGPVSTAMGGAAMAYDVGVSAGMSNPATLGLMKDGDSKLEVGVGNLRPAITEESTYAEETSAGDSFILPAIGWATKVNKLTYGVGMFSQGGMGTEFDNGKFMTANHNFFPTPDPFSGQTVRSEVGVGRLVFPLAYDVSDNFIMGGSVDFVWGGMDIQMDLSGLQFADLIGTQFGGAFGGNGTFGRVSGSLIDNFAAFVAPTLDPDGGINWGRIDFSDGSDFTGSAGGTGFAGKLGGVYTMTSKLRIGASYQSKTSMSDLKSSDATLTFSVNGDDNGGGGQNGNIDPTLTQEVPLKGKVKVNDFQWPEIFGIGVAFEATEKLLLVADYKRIAWSKVMKDFSMTFTTDAGEAAPFAGTEMDMTLYQNWEDQNVLLLGAGYQLTEAFTLRGGVNLANNPVPDEYLNPLFPAIIKNHLTMGVGYAITKASTVDFSLVYAPAVKQTSDYGEVTNAGLPGTQGDKVEVTHAQTNWQLMYAYAF